MPDQYTGLTIRIRAYEETGGFYPVEAQLDDGSRYDGGQLKLDQAALRASELDSAAYGRILFEALMAGDIRRAYDKATARAEALTEGRLRVQLWLDNDAAELQAIPWERLYHLSRNFIVPLATSDLTPFSRYTSLATSEPSPVGERPIRMLAAVANPLNLPGGLPPADIEVEVQSLRKALGDLRQSGQFQVSLMPGRTGLSPELSVQLKAEGYQILEGSTTLDNLVRHLSGKHIFHFIGHGSFRRKTEHGPGQAVLHLEKEDGSWQVARDDDIVARFAAIGDLPHLVFLVACESAARDAASAGGEDAFVGLGPKLVQAGFPAVVAMQAQVPVLTARQVAGEFYRRLMEHGQVDKAMSQARNLAFKPDRVDWGIPVLFMRLRAGQLFNVGELPKIEIENRSLEAAMPQAVRVKQRTEVRVMVAAAGSAGLRAHLPAFTESRELIDKTDVQASTVPVEFPTDPATNRPAPVELKASLTAPGFEIEQPLVRLRVPPKADSGVATFFLTAGTRQPLARVKVELRSANNDAYLGSTTLTTEVKDWQDDVAKVIWSLVTLPIGLAMVTKPEGEKPMLPEEKPHQGGINISTGAGEGGVTFGNVGGSINIGGQVVGRDAISTTTITNVTESAPASREANPWFIFETQMKKARKSVADLSLDDADKDELDELIRKVEAEVKKGEGADLRRLERWLGNIGDVSKEALAAVVRVLTNVAAKVPEPVRAIAEKTGG